MEKLERTLQLVKPGMPYRDLLALAATKTHRDVPGLLRSRFLLLDANDRIVYDRLLSLIQVHGIGSPIVRKVMYFTWSWRDDRLRTFITDVVANSEGKWRASKLTAIGEHKHFAAWMMNSSAQKARSNIENFFVETEIYVPKNRSIHLEMEDGWLSEAMIVAAQYEPDYALREEMVRNPLWTLFDLKLNALANLSSGEAAEAERSIGDFEQIDDDEGLAIPAGEPKRSGWRDREQKTLAKPSASKVVNLIALERANSAHLELERLLARVLDKIGCIPERSELLDLFYQHKVGEGYILVEIKSCTGRNFHSQTRRGVSQLLEYKYLHKSLEPVSALLLVTETAPPKSKAWLVHYLNSIGITLAWREFAGSRITTTGSIPPALAGVVHPA